MSIVREVFSRLLTLHQLTLASILREVNATLRRKEEARIYAWMASTGRYPPRREQEAETTARVVVIEQTADPPGNEDRPAPHCKSLQ